MTQFRYLPALDTFETALVERLYLERMSLPGRDSAYFGSWKDHPVKLSFRYWRGPKVAVARTVSLEGHDLEIGNLVAVARTPLDAPILGVDLVAARQDAGLVVADLSPLIGTGCAVEGLPEWARTIFSPAPLIARVTPDTAPGALSEVGRLCERFAALVENAAPLESTSARDVAVERYRDEHLRDDRMRSMLAHMFGEGTAGILMTDVLFPRELIDHVCA